MRNEEDFYAPITRRLKDMTKELSSAVNSLLVVSAGGQSIRKKKIGLDSNLKEAINHLSTAFNQWRELEQIIEVMAGHLEELDESTLAGLVEKSADSAMALEFVGQHARLKEVQTAHAMISLDNDLIHYTVKEVGSHSKEKLEKWAEAINDFLNNN